MRIVIVGGHHTSALPIIEQLKRAEPSVELFWFGHRHSVKGNKSDTLEYKEISALNIPFIDLKAGKFYKTYNPVRLAKIPFGFFQALYWLLRVRPQVILSFGGYLAVPVVLAGWLLGIPSVTHEQTVVAGYANRLIAKFVKKIMISWKDSEKFFPSKKVIFVGLPLRKSLFVVLSNSFLVNQSLPTVYITAGKTGSHKINTVVKEILPELLKFCNVIHQCGEHSAFSDYEELGALYKSLEGKIPGKYFLRKFVLASEIGEVFSKASLFISRAGAHTTYEALTFKKKAVLIPIPWVSHNEQYENAKVLEKHELGIILPETRLSGQALLDAVRANVTSGVNYAPVYDNTPAEKIVELILSYAHKSFS